MNARSHLCKVPGGILGILFCSILDYISSFFRIFGNIFSLVMIGLHIGFLQPFFSFIHERTEPPLQGFWATHWWFDDRFAYAYGSGTTISQFFHDCSLATLAPDSINWARLDRFAYAYGSGTTIFQFFHDCSLATLARDMYFGQRTGDRFAYAYGSGTTIFQFFHDCSSGHACT